MNKKHSFTLAEVLITLVIIGIIAAITVPMIMANHKKTEYSARLKKFYSQMNNAVKLAETEWGIPTYEWDYTLDSKTFFEQYLSKYVNCEIKEVNDGDESSFGWGKEFSFSHACYLNDGTFFAFESSSYSETSKMMTFLYDLNGWKKPNKEGADEFYFSIGLAGPADGLFESNLCHGFSPIGLDECQDISGGGDREYLKRNCKSNVWSCSALLFLDGWEFKDDYPYRL